MQGRNKVSSRKIS